MLDKGKLSGSVTRPFASQIVNLMVWAVKPATRRAVKPARAMKRAKGADIIDVAAYRRSRIPPVAPL